MSNDAFERSFTADDDTDVALFIQAKKMADGWDLTATCRSTEKPTRDLIAGLMYGSMDKLCGDGAAGNYVKVSANVGTLLIGVSALPEEPDILSITLEGLGHEFTPAERVHLLRQALEMAKSDVKE